MEAISQQIGNINDFLYGYILIALLIFGGIFFSIATRFVQFRKFKEGNRLLFEKSNNSQAVSGFQALMVSTASRVGVGNIAGVATAIALGGSGAVFWMWLTALLGGATACIENTMAQVYKKKNKDGSFSGGPAYYIQKVFHKRWLSVLFSICLIVTFAYGFECLQANLITSSMERYVGTNPTAIIIIGLIMAAMTAYAVFGGQKTIAKITEVMVPVMATIYLVFCLVVIITNASNLPGVFFSIFANAFDFKTIFAGFSGSAIMYGVKRGLYSNEAGMGSAPNAAATVETSHPAKQGFVQMLAVYIDTILICSATALMVLSTGVSTKGESALPLVQKAVGSQFGEIGILIITVSIFFFAFSTIIGNYYYTESNVLYILQRPTNFKLFRTSIVVAVFIGCIMDTSLAWNVADFAMCLMAILNVPALLCMTRKYLHVLSDYENQRKQGKNPVFYAKDAGIDDADYWEYSDLSDETEVPAVKTS